MILKLEDEIRYYRLVQLEGKAIVNACSNMQAQLDNDCVKN